MKVAKGKTVILQARPSPMTPSTSQGNFRSSDSGFTLLELIVVVVIIALLSSLVIVSLSGTLGQYELGLAAESIERFDARARREARRDNAPVMALIERGGSRIQIQSRKDRHSSVRLPGKVIVKQVRIRRRVIAGRQLELQYSAAGTSPTFAIEIERGNVTRWLLVLGMSGQVVALDREEQVDEILSI